MPPPQCGHSANTAWGDDAQKRSSVTVSFSVALTRRPYLGTVTAVTDPFAVPGVDALFEGELDDFIARRDALVRELKKTDKDAAAAVKALRKPSVVMWGVNQVARQHPEAVDDLVRAAGEVRVNQAKAVQGKDTGLLRSSTNDWRNRVRALAAEVAKLTGPQHRDDAAATFEAASANEALAEVLKAGRMLTALSPSGFGLEGMPEPPEALLVAAPSEDDGKGRARNEAAYKDARRKLDEREATLEKATHRLRRAEQRLEQAREGVVDAEKIRDAALAARDEAVAALEALD